MLIVNIQALLSLHQIHIDQRVRMLIVERQLHHPIYNFHVLEVRLQITKILCYLPLSPHHYSASASMVQLFTSLLDTHCFEDMGRQQDP